jgi:ribose/xylose/arabinose/galactoside ABC-type transport system permease subunit
MSIGNLDRLRRLGLWVVLLVVVLIFSIVSPTFRDPFNLWNILEQNAIIGIVACGMTVMMLCGGFDLSVGAVGATSSVIAAKIAEQGGGSAGAVGGALAVGIVIGLANGVLIARLKINAFVTTFAMASIVSGLLFVWTGAESTIGSTSFVGWLSSADVADVPVVFLFFLAVLAATWLLLTRTKLGHYIYSVGGNAEASFLSGVPVQLVQMAAFTIGGVLASVGGVLLLGQTDVGQPSAAASWPLDAIAICVVGGVALTGGVGRIIDVLAATLLLGVIANGLNQINLSSYWQPTVTGVVILGAVVLDQLSRRRRAVPAAASTDAATSSSESREVANAL